MINCNSSLLQVHQLYLREIKPKEHKNWRHNAIKYHNISIANKKAHNYAVNQLIKAVGLEYNANTFKLMSLIINEKFSIRKMSVINVDIALFKLENNVIL